MINLNDKLTTNEIRRLWLEFFVSKKHKIIPPASLIPKNDDTLLWINSGVATLKPYFDGSLKPPSPRLCNSQVSIRTNDIENVGITARHHTLFEMLGNFSIGDYFKKEAIAFAWEFLTSPKWLNLDANKMYITIFKDDKETYDIWTKDIKIDPQRIIKGDKSTNFWEIGQGPCGPNTEIFYDRGEKYDPQKIGFKLLQEDIENDRYLEVWNLVFAQFNGDGKGNYVPLPQKNIDTGAGLERLASLLQEVPTNFDSDQFIAIIQDIEKYTTFKYKVDNFFVKNQKQTKINNAFKVIADHIKCCTFAIGDGAKPTNDKRGYILRRLIRRAINYARKLNIKKPFLYKLVDQIVAYNQDFFPHLTKNQNKIKEVIQIEEEKFFKTIDKGLQVFEKIKLKNKDISGENAWLLYNSYGFPIDLTIELARENKGEVDIKEFEKLQKFYQDKTKKTYKSESKMELQNESFLTVEEKTTFVDDINPIKSKVIKIFINNKETSSGKGEMFLVFEKSNFFVATGGQVSDQGTIDGFKVSKVIKNLNGTIFHEINSLKEIKVGDELELKIWNKRKEIRGHHSGTHLLHKAVKEVLGDESQQMGSYVGPDKLRFDFNCNFKPSSKQIKEIETIVKKKISEGNKTIIEWLPFREALKKGVLAIFTETYDYDAKQRSIKIGDSYELCGGTHVLNSLDIEDFIITDFESKGSNLYRIEALTTHKLIAKWNQDSLIKLKSKIDEFSKNHKNLPYYYEHKISNDSFQINLDNFNKYKEKMIFENKKYQKNQLYLEKTYIKENDLWEEENNKIKIYVIKTTKSASSAFEVTRDLTNKNSSSICLAFIDEAKKMIAIGVGKNHISLFPADDLIKIVINNFNAKGGGSKNFAQCVVSNLDNLEVIKTKILQAVKNG